MCPFSSRVYHSVLTPASTATSSRRNPGTLRLVPAGSPTCAGLSLARRLARKSRTSARVSFFVTPPRYEVPRRPRGSRFYPLDRRLNQELTSTLRLLRSAMSR
ncbi:hypothetical protein Ahu01nite_085920 [Winogradskya humida]|uniref:Uncharacterized protein n=1 Tax=Winogradskya humida TaxID=113566 RepID=A0ABQ4A3R4_9ACTN|nr:hypothetical protein Ahu01nite_085920 [Actinoplanes humidus]